MKTAAFQDLENEFWQRVDSWSSSDCWLWTGRTSGNRMTYGLFASKPHQLKSRAHRWAYERFVGPIPDGLFVLHRCDVPLCVRPSHLFVGTAADNTADMVSKGRARGARGEPHRSARLTRDDVRTIRDRYAAGGVTTQKLGKEYGVSPSHVWRIIAREKWSWLD